MKKLRNLFFGIYLYVLSICIAISIVLNNTFFYKVYLEYKKLDVISGVKSSQIYDDYKKIINFINNPWLKELKFNNFTLSKYGLIHFKEVKFIFQLLYLFIIISLIVLIILALKKRYILQNHYYQSLNVLFYITIISFISLSLASFIDFHKLFQVFHCIIFNNDYWIFDTTKDSIITVLPMNFFLICLIRILLIVLIISIITKTIYIFNKKYIKE